MGHLVFLRWEEQEQVLEPQWLLGLVGHCGFDLVQTSQGSTFPIVEAQPYDFKGMKEVLRLGLPIGGIVFAEVIIFSLVGLLMAKFPSLTIASHQSAMNFST